MTVDESFPIQILRSLSKDLDGFWVSWIISLIPSVSKGVQMLLAPKRMGKANDSWEWVPDGSCLNSVLFLKDNCWTWVIYGVNDLQTQDQILKLGSLMIYLISHLTLESALYSDCKYVEPVNKKKWFKSALVRNRASDPLPFPWESNNCIGIQDALAHFKNMILSTSMGSKLPPPFLLVKLFELENSQQNRHLLYSFFIKGPSQNFFWMRSKPRMSLISLESKTGLNYVTMDPDQYATFIKHQCISCSYSMESPDNNDIACVFPVSTTFHYYQTDANYPDFSIFSFIRDLYSKAKLKCSDITCTYLFHKHILNYSHYKYNIAISMTLDTGCELMDDDSVYSWTSCSVCNSCTEKHKMTSTSLLYSFGKYLEVIFYSSSFFPKLSCSHCLDDGICISRNFSFKNLIVSFSKTQIQLFQVRISQIQLSQNQPISSNESISRYTLKTVEELSETVVHFYETVLLYIDQMTDFFKPTGADKIMMMLEDMRILFLEEEKSLLEHLKAVAFPSINDARLHISKTLKRDKESYESWVKEFAPEFHFALKEDFASFAPNKEFAGTRLVDTVSGHAIVLRMDEPSSLISFTLLSPEYDMIFSKSSRESLIEWGNRNGEYESKLSYFSHNGNGDQHIKYCKVFVF